MKKRILAMLLSALLVGNIGGCSYVTGNDIDMNTEKTETTEVPQGYEIPAGLQNILVGVQQLNLFAELPSRILFSHSLVF